MEGAGGKDASALVGSHLLTKESLGGKREGRCARLSLLLQRPGKGESIGKGGVFIMRLAAPTRARGLKPSKKGEGTYSHFTMGHPREKKGRALSKKKGKTGAQGVSIFPWGVRDQKI